MRMVGYYRQASVGIAYRPRRRIRLGLHLGTVMFALVIVVNSVIVSLSPMGT